MATGLEETMLEISMIFLFVVVVDYRDIIGGNNAKRKN